jgi:predicted acyltransferase
MAADATTKAATATGQRILALDVFRGMTIAFMIIVNTAGNGEVAWGPLQHARWHGFTPTDLVFPSFLFAIGISAWFSLRKYGHAPSGPALRKIWRRTAVLFAIGVVMWYVPGFVAALFRLEPGSYLARLAGTFRVMGVLQRLALCYGIGATLALLVSRRALIAIGAGLLLVYWWLLWAFGQGPDVYSLQTNAALRLDLWLFGPGHLYHGERVDGVRFAFDPEGVLSTIPAIVTFIVGYLTGQFLDRTPDRRRAVSDLFPAACLLVAAGFVWGAWLGFPINKKLWTSSYTLYAAGWSMLILALVMWATDVRGRAKALSFFNVFGRNPLLAYISSEVLATALWTISIPLPDGKTQSGYAWLYAHTAVPLAGDNAVGSFVFAVGYMLVNWLIAWAAYRRGLIVKV